MTSDEAMALRPGDLIYGPGVRAPIVRVTKHAPWERRVVTVHTSYIYVCGERVQYRMHTSYIYVCGERVQYRKRPWWATTRAGGVAQIVIPHTDLYSAYSLLPAGATLELAVLEANHVGDP